MSEKYWVIWYNPKSLDKVNPEYEIVDKDPNNWKQGEEHDMSIRRLTEGFEGELIINLECEGGTTNKDTLVDNGTQKWEGEFTVLPSASEVKIKISSDSKDIEKELDKEDVESDIEENNVIYYSTLNNQPLDNSLFPTNANIISNEWDNDKEMFKIVYDDEVTSINDNFLYNEEYINNYLKENAIDNFLLTKIDLSNLNNISYIGSYFICGHSKLTSIILPEFINITEINDAFICVCINLTQINLSPLSNVTSIAASFFAYNISLTQIDLSPLSKVISIGDEFLSGSLKLESIDLSPLSNITSIPTAFLGACAKLKSIDLSPLSEVTSIGASFLASCSGLNTIDLSPLSNVNFIDNHFLYNCSGLTQLDLTPLSNITTIEHNFLCDCSNLIEITTNDIIKQIWSSILSQITTWKLIGDTEQDLLGVNFNENAKIYVKHDLLAEYKKDYPTLDFWCLEDDSQDCLLNTNGYEYVDLGLSVLWATCNIGATNSDDVGNYYAWGCSVNKSTKPYREGLRVEGILPIEYDTARNLMGGGWRMPTREEFLELINNCSRQTVTLKSRGYLFTSNINGKTIFFPMAGLYNGTLTLGGGSDINCWSSTASAYTAYYFNGLIVNNDLAKPQCFSIRGVLDV